MLWTDEGDVVLDPFMGSGVAPVLAEKLGRKGVGFDIEAGAVETARQRAKQLRVNPILERGDARSLPIQDETVDFIITSPPYGPQDILKYGDDPQDIANLKDYNTFRAELKKAINEMYRVLKHDKLCTIIVEDRCRGFFYPLSAFIVVDAIDIGFEPWTIGVRCYWGRPLHPYGPEKKRRFIPAHEYILVFRKP